MERETLLSTDPKLPPHNFFDARISRRNFLKYSVLSLGALGIGTELQTNAIGVLAEQIKDQKIASLDNDNFIDVNKDKLSKVRLGCSFAPEQFGLSLVTLDEDRRNGKLDNALSALKFAVKDLGIKKVRLGIRWNNSVNENSELDFRLYEPFLDYCVKNDVDICINIGIKVFRWPEDHLPDGLTAKKHATVYLQSDLAKKSLDHTNNLFNFLNQKYGDEGIARITTIQPENEPFDGFGKSGLKIDPYYLKKIINLCLSYFPNSNLLVNSSNPLNLSLISEILRSVAKDNPQAKEKLISGYDYYPYHPAFPILPGLGRIDPISVSKIVDGDKYIKQKDEARKHGFKIEITEGQAEPWEDIQLPGNSAKAFRFMIQRPINHVLDTAKESAISIWGIEHLANIALSGQANDEHEEIFDLIQKINHA